MPIDRVGIVRKPGEDKMIVVLNLRNNGPLPFTISKVALSNLDATVAGAQCKLERHLAARHVFVASHLTSNKNIRLRTTYLKKFYAIWAKISFPESFEVSAH
eukprot:TRINITY_DN2584_c0_g1_i4.p3 TRINITY_DN2584_c0_g1~~TRINITY_DN2584_c0_g1_i4.p3  ORF type:complete len:102 (+),score=11.73 TRINITY_DN2584_c0_g1_i4:208-513(+)